MRRYLWSSNLSNRWLYLDFNFLFLFLFFLMFSNQPIGIALAATVSEFLSIRCVEPVERALAEPLAGEGSDLLPVVVARLAEVMCAEAEPAGGLAAVAALVHDEVGTVLGAGSHTDLHTVLLTEAADIVLGLSLVRLFLDFLSLLSDSLTLV